MSVIKTQTSSGRMVDLMNPDPTDILITDIASHLALQCRFNGATRGHYSVAQHSVLVTRLVPMEHRPYALLHDAHEAYIGDLTNPVKSALAECGAGNSIKKLASKMDAAIYQAFGLNYPIPRDTAQIIAHADLVALATEKRDLLEDADWSYPLPSPAKTVIKPMTWGQALENFMLEFSKILEISPAMVRAQEHYARRRADLKTALLTANH